MSALVSRFGQDWFDAQVDALGYVEDESDIDGHNRDRRPCSSIGKREDRPVLRTAALAPHLRNAHALAATAPKLERKHFWQLVCGGALDVKTRPSPRPSCTGGWTNRETKRRSANRPPLGGWICSTSDPDELCRTRAGGNNGDGHGRRRSPLCRAPSDEMAKMHA